ncbi:DEAD/DEAH box helicase [Natrialbaceae archaeon AArc-T1-2]|uniref:DEAD/DEAH box helicase n=1 Tax=Natrialbaceae archaeon AArc-T1-2 TaxID=3053904 RepID=UPI00255AD6D8|nr:DEAD/DEAH box helicase [Natrialbaceae archaeon AArc-T1-2]WIV67012.1 DEAD/DEAH box helicase [Natrialbaceae archaeon AArc-T1-2]
MSTYDTIEELDVFNHCLDELSIDLIKNDLGAEEVQGTNGEIDWGKWGSGDEEILPGSLDHEEVEKGALAASLLASSNDDVHKRKALAFGILAYLKYHHEEEFEEMYERYLYVILSRVGNLPAFQNVKQTEGRVQFEYDLLESLDSVLSTEIDMNLSRYSMEDGGVLSGFQRQIYDYLIEGKDVAISGPTSAGKSFILRRYIEHKAESESDFEAIYVVPTRALISEVSQKLAELNEELEEPEKEFEVLTGAHFSDQDTDDESETDATTNNRFLVVTPERCLKLIDPEVSREISPNLVFFDEFQNLEDDERGVLFESIIRTLQESYSNAQIVAAGPYLEEPKNTLENLTNNEVEQVTTKFTPVLQLKSTLKFISQRKSSDRKLELTIHSPSGNKKSLDIREPEEITYSDVKGSYKQTLPVIIEEFGAGSQNLIYSGRKDYAEDRAKALAGSNDPRPRSERTENLMNFLEETIHEEYSLIRCLKRGVAFHHGMVPKIAREEIENIYSESADIRTIVTTPTLMQGVNLPAEKIFLVGANRGQDELSDFEFNNLIGRVGRIDEKLYGAIYCIETEGDEWADEKLENSGEKEIEPATDQAISESNELINALQKPDLGDIDEPSIKYTSVLLRGRYLKDKSVDDYLEKKGMNSEDISRAKSALEKSVSNISVPSQTRLEFASGSVN